jgi:crotonobetainyl-CoA:carnitine CoA-transferase CaiB-like acyl-CoA transferase
MVKELPLAGIRVVEFGGNIAGPFGGWVLAELGAEVVKIERPEGDDARGWGPPFWREASSMYHSLNRNKRSVVADLTDPDTVAKLKRYIVERADVVLQNMRAGVLERLGFTAAELMAADPRLIWCNLNAFGREGPLAGRPGYDALMQAFAGIMSVTGEREGEPVRAGVSVVAVSLKNWCAIGILAALERRHRTGAGGVVDASLFETALTWMAFYTADYQMSGEVPVRHGSGVRGITPYQAYPCADGRLIVAAPNDRLFARLAEVLGHPEWAADARFTTSPARTVNRELLNAAIGEAMAAEPRAHWQARLDAVGVPAAPIQTVDEVLAHPQTEAVDLLQATPDGALKLTGLPLSFDGERPPLRHPAPDLGADTDEVLG